MPELPEVETVRRTLEPALGSRVASVWISGKPLRLNVAVDAAALTRATRGRVLQALRRRGKYLLLDFGVAGEHTVLVHLGMSGRFRLLPRSTSVAPHTHVIFRLEPNGAVPERELRYSDPRRFGQVVAFDRADESMQPSLARLGLDPLDEPIDPLWLHRRACACRRTLKAFLLDQRTIAGIGNIYASEALWQAGIRPTLRANKLSRPRARALAVAAREVMLRALDHGGTSLRDFVDADGHAGTHSHYLWVYGREGEPCRRETCSGIIRRTVTEGRATFFCPRCQQR